tara:strand:+ start:1145 stop:2548 length:1404 start_codon:yes stop_codon:yes gene_type:complete
MNILTDILSLIRRGVYTKTAGLDDVLVLGVNEEPDMTGVASPIPYKSVKVIKVRDFKVAAEHCDHANSPAIPAAGTGQVYQKTVVDVTTQKCTVYYRSLKSMSGSNLTLATSADDDYIEITTEGEPNLAANFPVGGSGVGVWKDKVGETLNFRKLIAGSNVTLATTGAGEIEISSTGGGGSYTFNITDGTTTQTIADTDTVTFTQSDLASTEGGLKVGVSATDRVTIGVNALGTDNLIMSRPTVTPATLDYVMYSDGSAGDQLIKQQVYLMPGYYNGFLVRANNVIVGNSAVTNEEDLNIVGGTALGTVGDELTPGGQAQQKRVTINHNDYGTAGTYASPSSITTNSQGHVTSITAGSGGSTVYRALLTQTTTGAPVETVLENTTGKTLTYTRVGVGNYRATWSSALADINKVYMTAATGNYKAGPSVTNLTSSSTNNFSIFTYETSSLTQSDSVLEKTGIEIIIYP